MITRPVIYGNYKLNWDERYDDCLIFIIYTIKTGNAATAIWRGTLTHRYFTPQSDLIDMRGSPHHLCLLSIFTSKSYPYNSNTNTVQKIWKQTISIWWMWYSDGGRWCPALVTIHALHYLLCLLLLTVDIIHYWDLSKSWAAGSPPSAVSVVN